MIHMHRILKQESGIAMLMALSTMVILGILAAELVYETEIYHSMVFQQRDQLRAKLLVKSALKLAKMQLVAAKKAKSKAKSFGVTISPEMIDQIWQTPLILPPPAPPGLSKNDTEALDKFKTSLGLEGSLTVTISGESDRLNLNQLVMVSQEQLAAAATNGVTRNGTVIGITGPGGTTPSLQDQKLAAQKNTEQAFVDTLKEILDQKKKTDDKFREQFATLNAETLILNLVAWMDPNTLVDGDNIDKNEYYPRLDTPYGIKNAPLASESELYMVKGFDDVLTKLFTENFTVQNTTSLDVNKASLTLINALIKELDPMDLDRLNKRRTDPGAGGPFAKADDFWKFLGPDQKFHPFAKTGHQDSGAGKRFPCDGHRSKWYGHENMDSAGRSGSRRSQFRPKPHPQPHTHSLPHTCYGVNGKPRIWQSKE